MSGAWLKLYQLVQSRPFVPVGMLLELEKRSEILLPLLPASFNRGI